MNLYSLQSCQEYVSAPTIELLQTYAVKNGYEETIISTISPLSAEMGFVFGKDPDRFDLLRIELIKDIEEITSDRGEQGTIFSIANKIMTIARDYRIYHSPK